MKERITVAVLALTAAGFSYTALKEGYSSTAIVPVPNDPYTVGLGSTQRDDGTPVRAGDKITPPQAIRRAVKHIAGDEVVLRRCFGDEVKLYMHEWDAYVDLAYNVGPAKVCNSTIRAKVRAEQYEAACRTILDFRRAHGLDCSLPANTRICGGTWTRRQEMAHQCLTGVRP